MSPLRRNNNAFVDGGGESTTTTTTHAFPYLGAKADAEGTTNTKARTTLFWNCIFKTALSVCVFLSTTELDTFALSLCGAAALDFGGGKPSGDECSSIIPIKLPERQRRRGDETSAFVRTTTQKRESVLDSIVPKRDGGKKKNVVSWTLWRALLFSPTPPLFLFRAHLRSRSSDDFRTFRRERTARTSRRIFFSFVLTQIIVYVPLF